MARSTLAPVASTIEVADLGLAIELHNDGTPNGLSAYIVETECAHGQPLQGRVCIAQGWHDWRALVAYCERVAETLSNG